MHIHVHITHVLEYMCTEIYINILLNYNLKPRLLHCLFLCFMKTDVKWTGRVWVKAFKIIYSLLTDSPTVLGFSWNHGRCPNDLAQTLVNPVIYLSMLSLLLGSQSNHGCLLPSLSSLLTSESCNPWRT